MMKRMLKGLMSCLLILLILSADPMLPGVCVFEPFLGAAPGFDVSEARTFAKNLLDELNESVYVSLSNKTVIPVTANNSAQYIKQACDIAAKKGSKYAVVTIISQTGISYLADLAYVRVSDNRIKAAKSSRFWNTGELNQEGLLWESWNDTEDLDVSSSYGSSQSSVELWSFTDELGSVVYDFESKYPSRKINLTITPTQDFVARIMPVLKSGYGAPDMYTGESAFFGQFVESEYWENLSAAPYKADALVKDKMAPYAYAASKDSKGNLKALTWQSNAGSLIARRDIALEVLGTDDPETVSKYTSTWKKYWELAQLIKAKTGGKKYITADVSSCLLRLALSGRKSPWVKDKKFILDQGVIDFFAEAKKARVSGYDAKYSQWSGEWSNSMSTGEVFGYILPTWGLHYVVKPNSNDAGKGKYMLVKPPVSYYWGGTWIGIYSGAKKPAKTLAWDFIKMLCIDDAYMTQYAKKTGDVMSNLKVDENIKSTFKDEFLKGQNHYAYYYEEAKKIPVTAMTVYDSEVEQSIGNRLNDFLNGSLNSVEEVVSAIKSDVKAQYPELKVD